MRITRSIIACAAAVCISIAVFCGSDSPSAPSATDVPQPEIGTWWVVHKSDTMVSVTDSADKITTVTEQESTHTYNEVVDSAIIDNEKYFTVHTYDTAAANGSISFSSHLFNYLDSCLHYVVPGMSVPGIIEMDTIELLILQLPLITGDSWQVVDESNSLDTAFRFLGFRAPYTSTVTLQGTASVKERTAIPFTDTTLSCHRVLHTYTTTMTVIADTTIDNQTLLDLLGLDSLHTGDTLARTIVYKEEHNYFNSSFSVPLRVKSTESTFDTSMIEAVSHHDTVYHAARVTNYHRVNSSDFTF